MVGPLLGPISLSHLCLHVAPSCMCTGKYEKMDSDRCPTTWPDLLRIRSENTNYGSTTAAP
jgi:hypothetical protein